MAIKKRYAIFRVHRCYDRQYTGEYCLILMKGDLPTEADAELALLDMNTDNYEHTILPIYK